MHKNSEENQVRPIFHPIAVAKIVASEIGLGATSIAALMHDVVEDTPITVKILRKCLTLK
jgi:GTP pyrophosphokinase